MLDLAGKRAARSRPAWPQGGGLFMPARVAVVHDDAGIRTDLASAGYEAVGFSDTRTALPAIEADQHTSRC
jgi:hypothetical protein